MFSSLCHLTQQLCEVVGNEEPTPSITLLRETEAYREAVICGWSWGEWGGGGGRGPVVGVAFVGRRVQTGAPGIGTPTALSG